VVEEDEPDEAVLEGCSPERDGGEERQWLELSAMAKEGARELERVGKKGR
jgi:hypothetical protein